MCRFLFEKMTIEQCFEPQRLRKVCEQQVQAWAARANTDAPDPGNYIKELLQSSGPVSRETHLFADTVGSEMGRLLCARQRRFTIAATAPKPPADGILRCKDTSYTFAILGDHQAIGAFDSHIGHIVVVQGSDAISAEVFTERVLKGIVNSLGASACQMEFVVLTADGCLTQVAAMC